MTINNFKPLVIWLLNNTSIDNNSKVTNRELREAFLSEYPEYKPFNIILAFHIGYLLKLMYGKDLIKTTGGGGVKPPITYYYLQITK